MVVTEETAGPSRLFPTTMSRPCSTTTTDHIGARNPEVTARVTTTMATAVKTCNCRFPWERWSSPQQEKFSRIWLTQGWSYLLPRVVRVDWEMQPWPTGGESLLAFTYSGFQAGRATLSSSSRLSLTLHWSASHRQVSPRLLPQ